MCLTYVYEGTNIHLVVGLTLVLIVVGLTYVDFGGTNMCLMMGLTCGDGGTNLC